MDAATGRWDPDSYLTWVRTEIPAYDKLQDELVGATRRVSARQILDLGAGTGETARRVLDAHPKAGLTVIDSAIQMLDTARVALHGRPVTFHISPLESPLPLGPFDLVTSALAIHHMADRDKADLYRRIADVLRPGGRFVLADLIVPDDPSDAEVELSAYDHPSSLSDHLAWLQAAGLDPHLCWVQKDLAVIASDKPASA